MADMFDEPTGETVIVEISLENRLFAALREFRRLGNRTVNDAREVANCWREADALLTLDPENDNPNDRYNSPANVEHRAFVDRMFRR